MDRRQRKTRKAIFAAFNRLLENKKFEEITVQNIIDEADIGRSTFYAHFETKYELIHAMCNDIFHHVFNERLPQEASSDYSKGLRNLELKLGHILFHLKDNNKNLRGLLKSDSSEILFGYIRKYLNELFSKYLDEFNTEIPVDFLLHHLSGSFIETIRWWMDQETDYSPYQVASFFMAAISK